MILLHHDTVGARDGIAPIGLRFGPDQHVAVSFGVVGLRDCPVANVT